MKCPTLDVRDVKQLHTFLVFCFQDYDVPFSAIPIVTKLSYTAVPSLSAWPLIILMLCYLNCNVTVLLEYFAQKLCVLLEYFI